MLQDLSLVSDPAFKFVPYVKKNFLFVPVMAISGISVWLDLIKKNKEITIVYQTIYINKLKFKTKDIAGVIKWGRMSLSWKTMR
jgi:hypothetical protein